MNRLIALFGGMVLVLSVSLAQAENINGVEIDEPMLAEEAMMSQDVGADFIIVRPAWVKLSGYGSGAIYSYWYNWKPDYYTYKSKAIINIKHTGNAFKKIIHNWVHSGGYNGYTGEPFAIANWGTSSSSGYCTIRVVTERQAFTSSRIPIYR